jgi:hypothetical protein
MTERLETVTVWAATTVPGPSPLNSAQEGYSVAWVDRADGTRVQVLTDGLPAPAPDTVGKLSRITVGEETVDVFVAERES